MYSISVFIGKAENTEGGQTRNFETFEDLAKTFSKCRKGHKHSAYFVRGALSPMKRKDENIATSRLIILDGDEGIDGNSAPNPSDIHQVLREQGLNHFIYTSHSHTRDVNKFRVVIPTSEDMVKSQLRPALNLILNMLGNAGVGIKNVKEMRSWSQPWFTPTRDDPSDGLFEFYEYHDGKEYVLDERQEETEEETQSKERVQEGDVESVDQMFANIASGREYHESILNLTWQLTKDGVKPALIIGMIRGMISPSDERSQARWDDVPRLVKDAVKKQEVDEFDLEAKAHTYVRGQVPRPPGMLGQLEQACYDSLLYQYREVSVVSALGLIAGIAGRRFNIVSTQRTGLNLYLTLVAGTGVGKDGINRFINNAIRRSIVDTKDATNEHFTSFIGPSSFTGAKGMFKAFKNSRSRVCVMSEAGLLMKVKSGDQEGKSAALLNAFNESGADTWTRFHVYSNEDDNISSLRAIAPTIISESTPEQLISAYQEVGALTSGYLPRQLVFKIHKRQTKMNRNVRDDFPDEIIHRLHDLLETCAQVQNQEDPMAFDMVFADDIVEDMFAYQERYNEISAENEGVDSVKQHMATRIGLKVIRVAAVATVFNKTSDDPDALVIDREEWEWAKALCDYEFEHITESLGGLSGDQTMENAVCAVYYKMMSIVENSIKSPRCQVDVRYRRKKIIPYSKLKIACSTSPALLELNDKYRMKLGIDKVLEHMERSQAIKIWDSDPLGGRSPRTIQLLPAINDYMRGFGL